MTVYRFPPILALSCLLWIWQPAGAAGEAMPEPTRSFDPDRDLLSLHYDHAPDKDDGHSAAADRTVLESLYGNPWVQARAIAVSGAYGTNAKTFNPKSDNVMDAVWNRAGGWQPAHTEKPKVLAYLEIRWLQCLDHGGDIWVKEGGQSDITADLVKRIRTQRKDIDTRRRIHVVQHSDWNETHTGKDALAYVKRETHYIRIQDANRYLNRQGGDKAFVKAASSHPVFGPGWKAAWTYYRPEERIDYSDTGELFHILGLGEPSLDEFRTRFLEGRK